MSTAVGPLAGRCFITINIPLMDSRAPGTDLGLGNRKCIVIRIGHPDGQLDGGHGIVLQAGGHRARAAAAAVRAVRPVAPGVVHCVGPQTIDVAWAATLSVSAIQRPAAPTGTWSCRGDLAQAVIERLQRHGLRRQAPQGQQDRNADQQQDQRANRELQRQKRAVVHRNNDITRGAWRLYGQAICC